MGTKKLFEAVAFVVRGLEYAHLANWLWELLFAGVSVTAGVLTVWTYLAKAPLLLVAAFAVCAIVTFLAAVVIGSSLRAQRKSSKIIPPEIELLIGDKAPFHEYKQRLHSAIHTIRVGVKNNCSGKSLTNCKLQIFGNSGEFSGRVPIEIPVQERLNPKDTKYISFASLDEGNGSSVAYHMGERKYAIQAYFPINPLSDKSNWLDHEPYELEIVASAAECPPFAMKCRLFVDGGNLKLSVANSPSTGGSPDALAQR